MRSLILLSLLLAACCPTKSHAQTVAFNPSGEYCPTYCIGFETDTTGQAIDWLNAVYANTAQPHSIISINGVVYSGDTIADVIGSAGVRTLYNISGFLKASTGEVISLQYVLEYWTTRVVSGRDAGRRTPHRYIDGGTYTKQ